MSKSFSKITRVWEGEGEVYLVYLASTILWEVEGGTGGLPSLHYGVGGWGWENMRST